ncbi:MAG: beta-propeller fold lactonase family protein [Planctomycetota bacterium]|nr:beta-propeller fold lactonase family protein [Planctomycetota bacterium]
MLLNKTYLPLALSIPALISLAACGGGGGGGGVVVTGPTDLDYGTAAVTLGRGIPMAAITPTVTGTVDTYTVSAGALPAGLALDAATGVISGVPTGIQAATLATVSATETGVGSDTFDLTFTVNAPAARALYSLSEDEGLLTTHHIHPTEGFLGARGYLGGLNSPRALTLTPDLEYLYVVNFANGMINAFDVDPISAELTELVTSPETMIGGVGLNPASVVTSPGGEFLFVADRLAAGISRFSIDAAGDLTELGAGPFTGNLLQAQNLVSLRRGGDDFLYVLAPGETDAVVAFSVDAAGALVEIDRETAGPTPADMTATPEGDLLYVLNQNDSTISGYAVGSDGLLTEVVGSPFSTIAGLTTFPLSIEVTSDGTNAFLYTTDNDGEITQSAIGAGGALTLVGSGVISGAGANYRGMAATPAADQLFVMDAGLDEIHSYDADASGALSLHPSLPRMRAQGDFLVGTILPSLDTPVWSTDSLYAAVKSGSVAQLTVDATGALDPITPLLVATTSDTEAVVMNPKLDTLYATNPGDATNTVMSIPIQGDLSLDGANLAGSGATSNDANFLDIDPNGKFLYMLANAMSVSPYPIGATGLLGAQGATAATGATPLDIEVSPTGEFAYVTNFAGSTVSQFNIDLATGAVTQMSAPTVSAGTGPRSVAIHPSGRYAYVSAFGVSGPDVGDKVGQYLVTPGTGALLLMSPASVGASPDPGAVMCTPNGKFLVVANSASGTSSIDVYAINTDPGNLVSDGTLSGPVSSAAVPDLAQTLEISADGSTVYVGSNSAGTIQAYSISAAGLLSSLDAETIGGTVRSIDAKKSLQ